VSEPAAGKPCQRHPVHDTRRRDRTDDAKGEYSERNPSEPEPDREAPPPPVAPPLRLIGLPTICGYRQSRPSIESTTSRRREWNIAGEISITSRDGQDWRLIVKQSPSVGIGGSSAH
jgi:hypothetical protein